MDTYNEYNQLHSFDDLPAGEAADGTKYWYQNGKKHRDNGLPAVEYPDGTKYWYQNGVEIDSYFPNLGCALAKIQTRHEALDRLNKKSRPHSRDFYMADIDRLFPEDKS